jgi:hypothetical protein
MSTMSTRVDWVWFALTDLHCGTLDAHSRVWTELQREDKGSAELWPQAPNGVGLWQRRELMNGNLLLIAGCQSNWQSLPQGHITILQTNAY